MRRHRQEHPTSQCAEPASDGADSQKPNKRRRLRITISITVVATISITLTLRPQAAPKDPGGPIISPPGTGMTTSKSAAPSNDTLPTIDNPTITPDRRVTATVEGQRVTYSGSCPPSKDQAPTFEATITVTRGPVDVRYRWTTSNGGSSDPNWHVIRFDDSGRQQQTITYTDLSYLPEQAIQDWVAVDIDSPVTLQSNRVGFATTCTRPDPPRSAPQLTPPVPPTPAHAHPRQTAPPHSPQPSAPRTAQLPSNTDAHQQRRQLGSQHENHHLR
jgi:hypothetical protein